MGCFKQSLICLDSGCLQFAIVWPKRQNIIDTTKLTTMYSILFKTQILKNGEYEVKCEGDDCYMILRDVCN